MARLQILQLPEGAGDDRPPFVLVVDQHQPLRYMLVDDQEPQTVGEFADVAEQIGARSVLVFQETVNIPANDALPLPLLSVRRDQTAELIDAHEQTRLALCDAFLLSLDTTWAQIVETAGQRQREVAGLYRKFDAQAGLIAVDPKVVSLARKALGIDLTVACPSDVEGALFTACRELEKSEAARGHLRKELDEAPKAGQDQRKAALANALGMDPLRDWDDIYNAAAGLRRDRDIQAEAIERVRTTSTEPEVMDSQQEHPTVWMHGYHCGVLAARDGLRPRNEPTVKP